jgi:hypothetical protein
VLDSPFCWVGVPAQHGEVGKSALGGSLMDTNLKASTSSAYVSTQTSEPAFDSDILDMLAEETFDEIAWTS